MFFPSPLALLVSFDTRFRPGALIRFGIGIGRCFFPRCCGRRGLGLARRLLLRRNERLRRVTRLGDHSKTFFLALEKAGLPGGPGGPPPAPLPGLPTSRCVSNARVFPVQSQRSAATPDLLPPFRFRSSEGRLPARVCRRPSSTIFPLTSRVKREAAYRRSIAAVARPTYRACIVGFVRTDALRRGATPHGAHARHPLGVGRNFCYLVQKINRTFASLSVSVRDLDMRQHTAVADATLVG